MAEKQKLTEVRKLLEKVENETVAHNAELESRLKQIRVDERRVIVEARDRVVSEAAELHRQIRQASLELRKKRTREAVDEAKRSLASVQAQLDSEVWAPKVPESEAEPRISVGDTVYLKETNLQATVRSISEETQEAELCTGQITLKVGINSIEKALPGVIIQSVTASKITKPEARVISSELDLRGKRADEAEVMLDGYLNDATLANLSEVLIIHGIGTGTVRQIVRDSLTVHPLVKSFRTGRQEEGGDGVTVVSL